MIEILEHELYALYLMLFHCTANAALSAGIALMGSFEMPFPRLNKPATSVVFLGESTAELSALCARHLDSFSRLRNNYLISSFLIGNVYSFFDGFIVSICLQIF